MKSCDLAWNILRAIQLINNTGTAHNCIVMDNGPNNLSAVKEMKVMDDTISVDGKKTYVFVDTPQLVKNTRNSMKNNGFLDGDGNKISWSYVQTLEAYNSSHFP